MRLRKGNFSLAVVGAKNLSPLPFIPSLENYIEGNPNGQKARVGAKAEVTSGFVSMFRSFDKLRTPQAQHIAGSTN